MQKLEFRKLNKDEIDVRIGTLKKDGSGASFLLYKDARVDMRLLDEVVGTMNWQRTHNFKDGKLYCTVSIWDDEKKQWISKEDVGVESNAEAEKGQASDSFKRACFNFGIGRELYTSPSIWIKANPGEDIKYTKMKVKHIGYDDNGKITELIIEDSNGVVRFEKYDREEKNTKNNVKKEISEPVEDKVTQPKITKSNVKKEVKVAIPDRITLLQMAHDNQIDMNKLTIYYKKYNPNDLTDEEIYNAILLKQSRGNK